MPISFGHDYLAPCHEYFPNLSRERLTLYSMIRAIIQANVAARGSPLTAARRQMPPSVDRVVLSVRLCLILVLRVTGTF
jgi:hypothetical protein